MKPGKKSAAAIALVAPPSISARPEPFVGLSERERELWRGIVISLPTDWFRTSDLPLLSAYCQAAIEHELAAAAIATEGLEVQRNGRSIRHPLIAVRHQAALRMGA